MPEALSGSDRSCRHGDYLKAPVDGRARIDAPARKPICCLRGGDWDMDAFRCRSTHRSLDWEHLATDRFKLRIVVEGAARER